MVAPDPEDEIRAVARRIMDQVEAGIPLHRLAILSRLDEPYGRLVPEVLDAAGISWNGPSPRRLADTVVARVLLGLLELADADLARDTVAAWLSSGPVLDPADGQRVPATRWDVISREAGVVAGAAQWADRLARHRAELVRTLATLETSDEGHVWRSRRLEGDIATIDQLSRFIDALATHITPSTETSWSGRAAWARRLVERYLGGEGHRAQWPETELVAARQVETVLAGLGALDALGTTVDATRFRWALARELDVPAGRIARFGHGVFVGPLRHAYGGHFDAVYIVGMVEGSFPPRGRDDPLLPDRDRRTLPGVALRADRHSEDRRDYLAALAAAPERVLCSSRADPRAQRTRQPARWLLETAEALHGDALGTDGLTNLSLDIDPVTSPRPWLESVASFEAGILHDHEPGSIAEHDLRELVAWCASGRSIGQHPLAQRPQTERSQGAAVLGAGVAALEARASTRLTAFDGFVGAAPLPATANRPMSPTALQDWASCPFRYFLARVLRVREVPKPETIQTISALDEGTLVHEILEEFLRRARSGDGPRTLRPEDPWGEDDWALMGEIVEHHCRDAERRGITGRPLSWQLARRRIRRSAERFLRTDNEVRADLNMVPSGDGVEVAFGDDTPVGVDIGNGRHVAFRGRIDRIDRSPDGSSAVVYDYKTGRARDIADDPVDAGRALQLPVYAAAARAHTGIEEISTYYWYTTQAGKDAALAGFELDEELEARFAAVVGSIVEGIERGCFVAVPGPREWDFRGRRETHANCLFCPYDRICPPDRSTVWERKGDDDAVLPFLALQLPDDEEASS